MGTWECSVHGPEGRLGAVQYELQITGTVPHGSVTNPFFLPCSVSQCPFLSPPHLFLLPFDHLDPIFLSSCLSSHQFLPFLFPVPCTLFQFASLVQSQPCPRVKLTFPSFLTVVPPHRCPDLRPPHHLQWAGYFWAHAHPLPPAYGLCSGSGPTKKGKCSSPHFC